MVEMKVKNGMAPVGAHRLAYTRMGTGSPVVVLEAAGGAPRTTWDTVMPAIAGFTQVISYDRQEYIEDPDDPEGIDFFACADQAREASGFGDLPLVVITAGNHALDGEDPALTPGNVPPGFGAAFGRMFQELQVDLTRLSTRGRQVIARNSGHFVHRYEPDLVVGIIREMVEMAI